MAAGKIPRLRYRRILLKLSGEALSDRKSGRALDFDAIGRVAADIQSVARLGVQVGIVVGGGNIFRGFGKKSEGIERVNGDHIGMTATVMNAMVLQGVMEHNGIEARVQSAVPAAGVAEPFELRKALDHLNAGRIVIFGGGTGNPYFSTDTAAALRASEIRADVLLKATKVDGVYSADPACDPGAKKYRRLSYDEAIAKSLRVMDAMAFSMCRENGIPIIVFDFIKRDNLRKAVKGQNVGTIVSN